MKLKFLAFVIFCSFNLSAQVNLNSGLVAFYPFTGNANDASGNGNNVTFNSATLTADRFGNPNSAYYFNGNSSYMVVPNSPSLNPSQISLVAIVKPMGFYQGPCHGNVIINKGNNDFNQPSRYRMRFDDNLYTNQQNCANPVPDVVHQNFYADFAANGAVSAPYLPYIVPDQWYCVVFTFDGSQANQYVNGILVGSRATSNLYIPGTEDLYFGSLNNPSFPYWFNGVIDDIRIYNRALNTAEVNALCLQNTTLCAGSLGDPVVNITFGAGNNPGQPLGTLVPGASTTHTYVAVNGNPATPTPVDGQYTITNNVPSNAAWFSGRPDHTPNDVNGYMAFYNSQETAGLEFYKQTVNNLCGGTTYEFAAWVANCLNPLALNGVDPNISFIIETTGGTNLGNYSTGPIPENTIFQWQQYGFFFTLPAGETSVVLKMINNSVGGAAQPGNDLAIDDITFRPCGPLLTASLSNSQFLDSITICQGSTQNLYGTLASGFTSPNYRWQTSIDGITWLDAINSNTLQYGVTPAASMGTYYMYRTVAADGNNINSFNCRIVSNTLYIRVNQTPQGVLNGDTICAGSAARFRFTATQGLGPFSISFRDPSGAVYTQNGITSGQPFFAPLNVFATTPFTLVSIRDGSGCERLTGFNSNAIVVTVRNDFLKAPRDTITCESSPVVLNGNNGPAYQYQWTPATFLNDPLSPTPVCTPLSTQRYSVRITDPLCGTDSVFSVQVNVNPKPALIAQKANDIDCGTPTAQLNAAGAQSYVWTPITGLSNPNSANPVASLNTTTTFTVTGTNSLGCSDTARVTVNVTRTGNPVFELPNAFTPNGDGRNDCFGIRRWVNVTVKDFSIFNRWGQLVFTSKNSGACWDGTLNGKLQPSGGYTYVIRATGFCGDVEKKGIIMLLR